MAIEVLREGVIWLLPLSLTLPKLWYFKRFGFLLPIQSICELVHPQIDPNALPEFLWQHLRVDLKVIGTALGRNREDSALLIHLLLDRMIANSGTGT